MNEIDKDMLTILYGKRIYGLTILEIINERRKKQGRRKIKIGSLYSVLKRMEKNKLIKSEWGENVNGEGTPRRKYYSLTIEGKSIYRETII